MQALHCRAYVANYSAHSATGLPLKAYVLYGACPGKELARNSFCQEAARRSRAHKTNVTETRRLPLVLQLSQDGPDYIMAGACHQKGDPFPRASVQ